MNFEPQSLNSRLARCAFFPGVILLTTQQLKYILGKRTFWVSFIIFFSLLYLKTLPPQKKTKCCYISWLDALVPKTSVLELFEELLKSWHTGHTSDQLY